MKILMNKIRLAIILLVLWPIFISCKNEAKSAPEKMKNSVGLQTVKFDPQLMMNTDKKPTVRKMKNVYDDNLELDSKEMKKIDKSSIQAFNKLKNFYRTAARSRFG